MEPEHKLLGALRSLGIGFIAYAPLGRGLLTGRITDAGSIAADDFRRTLPRFDQENLPLNNAIVDSVGRLAKARGVTTAQLALAWVLAQGTDLVPIPGTKSRARLEENVAAMEVDLTAAELAALEEIAPPGCASGDRYPDMSGVNR
jgi:aryl-alcohol dehydrogenase-like predicted oxidoreductase